MARPRRRKSHQRPSGKRLLVVCEGARDEYGYIRAARSAFRLPSANVVIESCAGGSPGTVVDSALRHRDRHGQAGSAGAFDETWIVLDAERSATSGIRAAVAEARRNGLFIALSNASFEVWLLMHRQAQGAALSAMEAKRECRKHFGVPLRGGRRATFDDPRLGATWETAREHARTSRQQIARDLDRPNLDSPGLVLERNPASNFDELLTAMRAARAGRSVA